MSDEQRKQRLITGAKWALGLGAAVLISPIIFLAVKGIVGLAIAAVLGLAAVNAAPYVAMKFANWKLKGIKHEAARNPIETLQNQLIERRGQLRKFFASIGSFRAEVAMFESKVELFKAQQPENADKFVKQLAGMRKLLSLRDLKYRQADAEVDRFEEAVAKAKALWEMSQAANRMNKIAGELTGDQFEKIKTEVAFESVERNLLVAFSDLEQSLLSESLDLESQQPAQLTQAHREVDFLPAAKPVPEFVTSTRSAK